MGAETTTRGLAAILTADVVGYSRLVDAVTADAEATISRFDTFCRTMNEDR